jgi:hypothetical protein
VSIIVSIIIVAIYLPLVGVMTAHAARVRERSRRQQIEAYCWSITIWGVIVAAMSGAFLSASDSDISQRIYIGLITTGICYMFAFGFTAAAMWIARRPVSPRVLARERELNRRPDLTR